jgi:arylsulfatase A-like enzyme
MPKHNDMRAMVDQLVFEQDRPTFQLLNVGETHYPYARPDEDPGNWPRISGVHGVVKRLGPDEEGTGAPAGHHHDDTREFFDQTKLDELRDRQIDAVTYLDEQVFPALFDKCPKDTWVIVTSDHGELFGEGDFFGHGPVMHEKVFEVPLVEGIVP